MEHDIRLEDIGWKVLRQRQVNLDKFTRQAARGAHDAHGVVQLLDLALGSGRHLMESIRSMPELNIEARLQDEDESNLEKGRQLANRLGLTRLRFAVGDAFDEQALASLDPSPNVVITAGLFELTPDNQRVTSTLRGLSAGMQDGGYVVYTDQPRHPHLEMIGRVAVQREESPWAMRRRPADEMDGLVTEAGFTTIERLIDEHGLFTVGLIQNT
jgi:Putative methyltransferase